MNFELYERPEIYDILCTPGTAATIDALERLARRHGPVRRGRPVWLEPACGSGRHLRVAARRGVRVIGFDRSARMIEYARRRLAGRPGARLFVADMVDFPRRMPAGPVDLAFNVDNTIRHLDSDRAMTAHLDAAAGALRPGGLYVVGLSFHRPGIDAAGEDVWQGRRGACRVTEVVQCLPPAGRGRRERILAHLSVERPGGTEVVDGSYDLRTWTVRQWRRAVAASPFEWIETVDSHGAPIAPGVFDYQLLVLRRPAGARSNPAAS